MEYYLLSSPSPIDLTIQTYNPTLTGQSTLLQTKTQFT